MRIAYLITAYNQPAHLARLVRALAAPRVHVHVHVDARVDIAPFAAAVEGTGAVLLRDRVKVQWMGFSQVESILRLLRSAAAQGFDRCVLLSGSDYPLLPAAGLQRFFASNAEELITFWRLEDRPSWLHKIQYRYPIDAIPIRGWSKGEERVYWRRLFWGRFHQYRRWMPRRRFPFDLVPYGGSDWWSLTGDCARDVLRFVDEHPEYSRFYRYTHCPSEMFFHTIVLNSRWAGRVRNFGTYEAWRRSAPTDPQERERSMLPEDAFNLRYIDWSGVHTGLRETPAVLDERDWESLRASACLFARKFDERRSAALLDRIDRELLGAWQAEVAPAC